MKRNQILAVLFGVLTVFLLCAMCASVAFSYARMLCYIEHQGASAPASVSFLLAVPFGVAILLSAGLGCFFARKWKS